MLYSILQFFFIIVYKELDFCTKKETIVDLFLINLETERFELSSGMGYKPASTSVGLLISINYGTILSFYLSEQFRLIRSLKVCLNSATFITELHLACFRYAKRQDGLTQRLNCAYAARALTLEKSAFTTLFVAFILICSLITQNSAETRSLITPIHPSNPKRPHI